jgi:hypothetical protein
MPRVGRTAGDESQLWRKFEKKDKKCKLILMTVRVYITSLNIWICVNVKNRKPPSTLCQWGQPIKAV